ncbi:MAG TPA: urease accessory protein UreD [Bordetella sp.]
MYRPSDAPPQPHSASSPSPSAALAGWQARLHLGFARQGERTVLAERRHEGPLTVQKPLYPEGGSICHAVIVHPPGGLAAGDQLRITLELRPGAHALLTTPGATKWYKGTPGRPASQHIDIALQQGARLDWLPQDNIFFDDSHARQQFTLRLAEGATALGWDAALLGRRASGESWRGAGLRALTRIMAPDGRPLWEERQMLHSASPMLDAPQGLDGRPAYGTLWAAGPACVPELAQSLAETLPFDDALRAGATALPGGLLLVRGIAREPEALQRLFRQLWLRLRPLVHGVPGQALRLWAT